MNLLFLDFETQSDDPANTNITEIGATPVILGQPKGLSYSQLIYEPNYPSQTQEIVELTGITDEILEKEGIFISRGLLHLYELISAADYVLAHNLMFDKTVYSSTCLRHSLPIAQPKKGWICTVNDIKYPKKYKCKRLSHLAFDHGVIVDRSKLHRASGDTELLAELILTKYDFMEIIKYWETPWVFLKADIPGPWVGNGGDGGIGKSQATKLGYVWEKIWGTDITFPKCWVKRCKETEIEQEKLAPFKIKRLMP